MYSLEMKLLRSSSVGVIVVLLALVVAAMAVSWRRIRDVHLVIQLHAAVTAVNSDHLLEVPLRSPDVSSAVACISAAVPVPENRYAIAARLKSAAEGCHGNRAAHALAVSGLLAEDAAAAVEHLARVNPQQRDAALWANLAAARILSALRWGRREDVLQAITAADHALPHAHEAAFTRALAIETLGARAPALKAWEEYLVRHKGSSWATRARERHAAMERRKDDVATWTSATAGDRVLTVDQLRALVRAHPQQARTYGESVYLAEWADAVNQGDLRTADHRLSRIRVIAQELLVTTGEAFLQDVMASIDDAASSGKTADILRLTEAFIHYRKGRLAGRDRDATAAATSLLEARQMFAGARNPMELMAECHRAVAMIDQNRSAEARELLSGLVGDPRTQSKYKALRAFALYHIALCDASQGDWTESLRSAIEAHRIFSRLGERGLAGTVESLMSQAYAFLGDDLRAWTHGLRAIALVDAAGDRGRLRVILAGLSRTELRHARWEEARALIAVESSLSAAGKAPVDDAEMLLRLAIAEFRLGNPAVAQRALQRARASAHAVKEPIRGKLLADIAGVAGSIARHTDPASAVSLLDFSIDYQHSARRNILLPQLYLERGRTHRALGRTGAARADYVEGIRQLELQRGRTVEADLRAGIFDDASELFDEAIAVALEQRDVVGAFEIVERGRARAIVEEIRSRERRPPPEAKALIANVSRSLPADGVLLEYVVLHDRMAIFTVDRDGLDVVMVPVMRDEVQRNVQDFIRALTEKHAEEEVQYGGGALYDLLIAPVAHEIRDSRTLIVVPDSTLEQLPFAALYHRTAHNYLIEQFAVITAPGATVFTIGAERLRGISDDIRTAVVVANPAVDPIRFSHLPPLPGSDLESYVIARRYDRANMMTRSDATIPRFLASAPFAHLVHYSGHSVIRPTEPWRSALLFAPAGNDGGTLSAQQIADMRFTNTRIVVLASCSTLRGDKGTIEGVRSVARAFLVAGVPTVIGTLWDIDDDKSAVLMRHLHERMAKSQSPVTALRAMQLETLRGPDPELRQPIHWAAFALLGADRY